MVVGGSIALTKYKSGSSNRTAAVLLLRFARNVIVMDCCRGRNLRIRFINRIPFCFRSREINVCQATAPIERIIANACDAVGNCNARQTTATPERTITNACDAVGNRNACQTTAFTERSIVDDFCRIRNCEACNRSIGYVN